MSVNPFPNNSTSKHVCDSEAVDPAVIPASRETFVKLPVVLAELAVQIPMHARIDFPAGETVLEVKTIGKKTYVTQCKLLNRQPREGQRDFRPKVYLAGFVRKNIQYASFTPPDPATGTPGSVDAQGEVLTTIKSLTVDVQWDCVTEVDSFLSDPVGPFYDQRADWGYLITRDALPAGNPAKDRLNGTDLSQFHQDSTQFFNEMPFCELVQADIIEIDEALTPLTNVTVPPPAAGGTANQNLLVGERTFTALSEKMVLELTVKLLQLQQVRIASLGPVPDSNT
ncbi:DUF3794 domain-containing protein [Fictibacillus sp. b24]|uniref:CsxC family protein n=1 Tax=Fictibacillus sp. b24 TaxID=3055863 RepID=UPI0025A2B118|nr:DUF3794 domain-containing protein [Fictibacillus sp. b24]MDM5316739.1 DUF3794 domain-containing protein [Fictibacillus sp. b24]